MSGADSHFVPAAGPGAPTQLSRDLASSFPTTTTNTTTTTTSTHHQHAHPRQRQHHSGDGDRSSSRAVGDEEGNDNGNSSNGTRRRVKHSTSVCRFFTTKSGCRAGDACRYQHVANISARPTGQMSSTRAEEPMNQSTTNEQKEGSIPARHDRGRQNVQGPATRAPVSKPVPQAQKLNPRDFQINQVVRRFNPSREDATDGSTILVLSLSPSDPDFPFELDALQCRLTVPSSWPAACARPLLQVQNTEIPRGYQINIERGFSTLINTGKSLLALLNDLDRNLERFLSSEKAQTIKIVANRGKTDPAPIEPAPPTNHKATKPDRDPPMSTLPVPIWTKEQEMAASDQRISEIQQLEARMGRLPLFSASGDKTTFNIPLQHAKPGRLPSSLQALKEVVLTVPKKYNLVPCHIKLKGVTGKEVDYVESAFSKYVVDHQNSTLMAHINYLTQHLHEMAVRDEDATESASQKQDQARDLVTKSEQLAPPQLEKDIDGIADEDRPHLVFLSKPPPEWKKFKGTAVGSSDSSSSDEYDSDSEDEIDSGGSSADEGQDGGASIPTNSATSSRLGTGVLLSFPHLEMTGIELLEVRSLSITAKCDRCKTQLEMKNIKPEDTNAGMTSILSESCSKCASTLSASYRSELIHANSIKAGFLDLQGCTVVDMNPSTFLATCSECSTTQSPPGTTAVRGDTALSVCRTCHKKQTFHIHEAKFLRVSSNDDPRLTGGILPLRKKKQKEELGITTGTELPSRGRCKHYSKSFRWFRFSCCQRVYPCDRCHDENESHPNEHANRMICGWCSREQNYRPEDCGACTRSVVRKTGGGFWEGGKGTRDRVKMSRKDPRKRKRIGGTNANKSSTTAA